LADTADRLSHLLHAFARINQDQRKLPAGLSTKEAEVREAAITDSVLGEFDIPRNVWSSEAEEFEPEAIRLMVRGMRKWCAGKMDAEAAAEFFASIDDEADLDWSYVFTGVPLRQRAPEELDEIRETIIAFGCRRTS
jgi:hypothetical protein